MKFLTISTLSVLAASLVGASSSTAGGPGAAPGGSASTGAATTATTGTATSTTTTSTTSGAPAASGATSSTTRAAAAASPATTSTTSAAPASSASFAVGDALSGHACPVYVAVTANPKVKLHFNDKHFMITPDFNNPAKMLAEMKAKIQEEVGADVPLTFNIAFGNWDARKYDVAHHCHKYTNKVGLFIKADLADGNVNLTTMDPEPVDEHILVPAFKKYLFDSERERFNNDHEECKKWLNLVNPVAADSPFLQALPEDPIEAQFKLFDIKREVYKRRYLLTALYKKVLAAGLDTKKVFGNAYGPNYNIDDKVESMPALEAAQMIAKANEALLRYNASELRKYPSCICSVSDCSVRARDQKAEAEEKLAQQHQIITAHLSSIGDTKSNLAAARQSIEAKDATITGQLSEISALTARCSTLDQSVLALGTEFEAAKKKLEDTIGCHQETINSLQEKVHTLNENLAEKQHEITALEAQLNEEKNAMEANAARITLLETDISLKVAALEESQATIASLKEEIEALKAQILNKENDLAEVERLQTALTVANRDISTLQQEKVALTTQVTGAHQELAQLEKTLNGELAELKVNHEALLKQKDAEIEIQLTQRKELEEAIETAKQEAGTITSQMAQLQVDLEEAKKKCSEKDTLCLTKDQSIVEIREMMTELASTLEAKEQGIQKLGEELREAEAALDAAQKWKEIAEVQYPETLKDLELNIADLDDAHAKLAAAATANDELQKHVASITSELEEKLAALRESEQKCEEAGQCTEKQRAEIESHLKSIASLRSELADARMELSTATIKIDSLEQLIQEKNSRISLCDTLLVSMSGNSQVAKLTETIEKKKQKRRELKKQIEELKDVNAQLAFDIKSFGKLKQSFAELKAKNETDIVQLTEANLKLVEANGNLVKDTEGLVKVKQELEVVVAEMKGKYEQAMAELNEANVQLVKEKEMIAKLNTGLIAEKQKLIKDNEQLLEEIKIHARNQESLRAVLGECADKLSVFEKSQPINDLYREGTSAEAIHQFISQLSTGIDSTTVAASKLYQKVALLDDRQDLNKLEAFKTLLNESLTEADQHAAYAYFLKKLAARGVRLDSWIAVALQASYYNSSLGDIACETAKDLPMMISNLERLLERIKSNESYVADMIATLHTEILVMGCPLKDTSAGRFLVLCQHNPHDIDPHLVAVVLDEMKVKPKIVRGLGQGYQFLLGEEAMVEIQSIADDLGVGLLAESVQLEAPSSSSEEGNTPQ